MLEVEYLFDGRNEENNHNNRLHMHEITSLLGEPPEEFLRARPHSWRLFDENGKWKAEPPLKPWTLERREKQLVGGSRELALDFLRCMLRWLPKERLSARELLNHPWLAAS
jgi:serine/threonine-protein kinase SRPK3